ncbi:nucleobase-ascorbate transporter LPE1 [Zea mays]|uniref:Leaf permease1 n=2 Tax=Zea mays TaxID=4577 RepID=A0A1D6L082_MAIZE|nr:nucleobase-ascorbate transporter LPE1 [Zea mays]ONM07974.1 leaf permease1 [Zea mays]|eukprot:NP_001105384.2 nucleobase-ascorbate transporter LPE1 [Zea mays]
MPPVKAEDLVVHAVKEQFAGLDYCITSPPPWITTVLVGFQHYLVMLGTTVLIATIIVPLMGGGHAEKAIVIQTILFLSGINTLLQVHFGTRLPAVMSGSYTYIYPAVAIILSPRYALLIDPLERFVFTMRSLQGALIIAGVFQAVVGFFGIWRVFIRFLSPLAAVPFVTLTGLGLFFFAFPGVTKCIEVGLPALVLLVIFAEYASHVFAKGSFVFSRCAVLVTVVIIWIYAEILTAAGAYNERGPVTQFSCRADRSGIIQGSPWVRFPYPFQWGYPIFCFQDCFAMLAASFASLIESTGTLIAVSRYSGATFCPPSVFSRGIGWEGISIILDGMCGTLTGTAASVENAGLLAVTRVGSRRVIKISALFMIFFSLFAKFGAVLASIPLPIFAALYCVLFAYSAGAGFSLLQYCNLNSLRTKFILSISLFLGLSIPQYFRVYEMFFGFGPVHTHSVAFNVMVNVIFSSPATVAAILAYLLDCTHLYWEASVKKDRGWFWWEKFKSYKYDGRSEEFYRLPYGLSRYFPSL